MKAERPIDFRTLVKLVTALQRLERFAQQDGRRHLSPHETLLLQTRIARLRQDIPSDILNSYETVKRSDPKAFLDPQLFPLVVLLAAITVWAGQRLRYSDFQDHAGRMTFRIRRVKWPGLRHGLATNRC
ncbi:MAG TPA: hypothetical protein VMV72_13690 [Verrucomicrobiae bacterium]|nr:hypothetical protein [Verrucomicrobiae bacterium]